MGCWICGLLPMSSTSGLPWRVSPLQGTDWHSLHAHISEIIYGDSTFWDKSITNQKVSSCPMINGTWNLPGHTQTFSYPQTIKILTDFIDPQINVLRPVPKLQNPTYRCTEEGIYQIWDTCVWLTPTIGRFSQKAILCWEQRNHTCDTWADNTRRLGCPPLEASSQVIVLQATDRCATDWLRRPRLRRLAPNEPTAHVELTYGPGSLQGGQVVAP